MGPSLKIITEKFVTAGMLSAQEITHIENVLEDGVEKRKLTRRFFSGPKFQAHQWFCPPINSTPPSTNTPPPACPFCESLALELCAGSQKKEAIEQIARRHSNRVLRPFSFGVWYCVRVQRSGQLFAARRSFFASCTQ